MIDQKRKEAFVRFVAINAIGLSLVNSNVEGGFTRYKITLTKEKMFFFQNNFVNIVLIFIFNIQSLPGSSSLTDFFLVTSGRNKLPLLIFFTSRDFYSLKKTSVQISSLQGK